MLTISLLFASCAFSTTHNLPNIENSHQISSFKNKTVFLRVFENIGAKENNDKLDVASYHRITEIIKKEQIWKKVFYKPSLNFFQLRQDELHTYDDLMSKISPLAKDTDYTLEIYFKRKYNTNWYGIFGIISLGLIPTTEDYDVSIKLRLFDKDNQLIDEVTSSDHYNMWVTTLPLPIGLHFPINKAEDFMKRNLLLNALNKLKGTL